MATRHWYMTVDTYKEYLGLHAAMQHAWNEGDLGRFEELKDQFESLPGFPGPTPDGDITRPRIVKWDDPRVQTH